MYIRWSISEIQLIYQRIYMLIVISSIFIADSYLQSILCNISWKIQKKICPPRGHILVARFTHSSLRIWSSIFRIHLRLFLVIWYWSSRQFYNITDANNNFSVTKFVFDFEWKFNLLSIYFLQNIYKSKNNGKL